MSSTSITASTVVLRIPELLTQILLNLSFSDILHNAHDVNQQWRSVIDTTPCLLWKTFRWPSVPLQSFNCDDVELCPVFTDRALGFLMQSQSERRRAGWDSVTPLIQKIKFEANENGKGRAEIVDEKLYGDAKAMARARAKRQLWNSVFVTRPATTHVMLKANFTSGLTYRVVTPDRGAVGVTVGAVLAYAHDKLLGMLFGMTRNTTSTGLPLHTATSSKLWIGGRLGVQLTLESVMQDLKSEESYVNLGLKYHENVFLELTESRACRVHPVALPEYDRAHWERANGPDWEIHCSCVDRLIVQPL